ISYVEHAVEYHCDYTVPKLAVDRLAVVPLRIHNGFQPLCETGASHCFGRPDHCMSSDSPIDQCWTRGRLRARSSYRALRLAIWLRRCARDSWTMLVRV